MEDRIINLLHCAKYIKERTPLKITEEEILQVLELETEYMIEYGYAE